VLLVSASMLVGGAALAHVGTQDALAQPGTTASQVATTATTTSPASPLPLSVAATPDALRGRIIDMMKDHMGFSDQQASRWADAMTGRMQAVYGAWTGIMLDQMDQFMDQYVYGYSMMNGAVSGNGSTPGTMMGNAGNQSGTIGTPGNSGSMMNGRTRSTSGNTPSTMMGGKQVTPGTPGTMMGRTTTTMVAGSSGTTTATTRGSVTTQGTQVPGTMMGGTRPTPAITTPVTSGAPGTMMNRTSGATSPGTTSGMMGGGGMGSRR
jgi:hypothetical protein